MKMRLPPMPLLRLAYVTLIPDRSDRDFLPLERIGGQGHLDLMPWYLKLGLGVGAAFAIVKAASAAVSSKQAWNGATLRWCGILLVLLVVCGLASYYEHVYGQDDEDDDDETVNSGGSCLRPSAGRQRAGYRSSWPMDYRERAD